MDSPQRSLGGMKIESASPIQPPADDQHKLMLDGAPYDDGGKPRGEGATGIAGPGRAMCSCGSFSDEILPSGAARKRWFASHTAG